MSERSRAPGDPITAAKRLLSSVRLYTCSLSSQPTLGVISPAGHISRSLGRKDPMTARGSTLSTSRSMTTPASSTGANMVWRTVKPAWE